MEEGGWSTGGRREGGAREEEEGEDDGEEMEDGEGRGGMPSCCGHLVAQALKTFASFPQFSKWRTV